MIRQRLTITYRDDTTADVLATQYGLGRFMQWITGKGWPYNPTEPGGMAVVQLRYMAWAELMRDATAKVSYEAWDATVDNVEGEPPEPVDPTRAVTSAAASPD